MVELKSAKSTEGIRERYTALAERLNERSLRLWAGAEAICLGRGGIRGVAAVTGLAINTVRRGIAELRDESSVDPERVRGAGGGRKQIKERHPKILPVLEALVAPLTRGDPMSPLRWTCKSVRRLAEELKVEGYNVSHATVAELLGSLGYSLQSHRKRHEGKGHADRDDQFGFINKKVEKFQSAGQPVISVDTKKKELVGPYRNGGREWHPKGQPEEVNVYDFIDKDLGKAIPYGVYDLTRNEGWVSVGSDHDTAEFAVESIRRWWEKMGKSKYPNAKELLITADGGGSNSSRCRLWKWCLAQLSLRTGLRISVCHFPPATSKWNKIEHRLFCHITQNWRGKALVSHEVVVQLIAATSTKQGLKVRAGRDQGAYELGKCPTPEQLASIKLEPATFHGEWNYTILP